MVAGARIFIITGTPGSGKSTVAVALMRRFEYGLHIPVDELRERVVSGIAHPVPEWSEETSRQFGLARQAAVATCGVYAAEGFAVAIDDVIFPEEAQVLYEAPLAEYGVHKVLLRPGLETALRRNAERTNKGFNTGLLEDTTRDLHLAMGDGSFERMGWIVIDSSRMGVEETVDEVLRRCAR
jgi:chloramphenicol 3-O-phosphotransferase